MASSASRGNPSLGDILRTVGVLGAAILLVWGVTRVFAVTPEEPPVPEVDYREIAAQAQGAAEFPLVGPADLPGGWKATSARLRDETWTIGVLTDDQEFVGLWQSELGEDRAVEENVEDSIARETVDIDGEAWTRWDSPDEALTLSRESDGTTVVVSSTLDADLVEDYVSSLEPLG